MSERDGYEHGVPCWVDSLHPDPEAAAGFYSELLGWEAEETTPPGAGHRYFMCRLRGRDVAAIGSQPSEGAPPVPVWTTYVWVESAEDAAARATDAGGSVLLGPFDALDGGRIAILADPAGAVIGAWEPGSHKGARLVNEPGAWSMSGLNTPDPEGAKPFYSRVFGWEPETFEFGDTEGTLCRLPGYVGGEPEQPVPRDVVATMVPLGDDAPPGVPPHWSIDFWVDDLERTLETAVERGGAVVAPPYEIPGTPLRQAVLTDPQGASFSVTKVTVGP
jgi:predicted enzyme related to lactoylglutathione lyase